METVYSALETISSAFSFFSDYDYSGVIFWLKMLSVFVSTLLVYGIIYSGRKESQIYKAAHAFSKPVAATAVSLPDRNENLEEWAKITKDGDSLDENERKFALIAADTLVEKILDATGYKGENLGERLKKIEKGDLDSLDALWEAHKIRNRIAHEADYKLSREDAARALKDFESVLKELEYI